MTKNNKSTSNVTVPNSIYDELYRLNAREIRVTLFLVQLLNEQACIELTNSPKVTIKVSKLNKLTSNKSLQVLKKVQEYYSDVLHVGIEGKTFSAEYVGTPITYDFTKMQKNKLLISLFTPGTFTVLRFDNLVKLRKKNTINLYLTVSKFSNTNKLFSSDINTLFEDCHQKTLGSTSKKTLILNAIDDLNTHVGRDVVSLNELANNVMLSFNSSLFSVWQFDNKGKEQNKPKTHREKDELIRSLKSENNMLNKTIKGNDEQKETTEKLYQEELDNLREQLEKLQKDNEQLKKENEELRQANKDLASSKGINTNLRDNRVDKLQGEIKELKENQEHTAMQLKFLNDSNRSNDVQIANINKKLDELDRMVNIVREEWSSLHLDKFQLKTLRDVADKKVQKVHDIEKLEKQEGEINNLKNTISVLLDKIEKLENNNQHQGTFEDNQQHSKQKEKEHHGFDPQKDSYDDFNVVDFDDFNRY